MRRPHDYNPSAARELGPVEPSAHLNVGLLRVVGRLADEASVARVSVAGLPRELGDEAVVGLMRRWGALRAFTLLRGADGAPTGQALAEYADPAVLPHALAGLGSLEVAPGRRLTVARVASAEHVLALQQLIQQQQAALLQRLTGLPLAAAAAAAPAGAHEPAGPGAAVAAAAGAAAEPAAAAAAVAPSSPQQAQQPQQPQQAPPCVVRLDGMVTRDQLADDAEVAELLDDVAAEVAKYGALTRVAIPRPAACSGGGADPPGVGGVFLVYADAASASRAATALQGRAFDERSLAASLVAAVGDDAPGCC